MEELTVIDGNTRLLFAKGFVEHTKEDIDDVNKGFFRIGFRFNEAVEQGYPQALGYADIYELAEEVFGFKRTTTKNLMAINREYCEHYPNGINNRVAYSLEMNERYKGYNQSQLVEMLPLNLWQRERIPKDFKESEMKIYKKILSGEISVRMLGLDNTATVMAADDPRKYVDLYKEKKRAEAQTMQSVPSKQIKKADDVPPGQLYLDQEEEITEFHQSGAEELVSGQSTDQTEKTDLSKYIYTPEQMAEKTREILAQPEPARIEKHLFKNREEREAFILNKNNYKTVVLESEELQIKVSRIDLANGAKIYRTDWKSYHEYHKEIESGYTLHLVDNTGREMPKVTACCSDYSGKCYTLTGTAMGFILDYMAKYRDEI